MEGGKDDDERNASSCRALWLLVLVAGVAAHFYIKKTNKVGMQTSVRSDDFVKSLRSYYEPEWR
jgi:hypothetical protein